jgi:hypothetical protein
VPSTRGTATPRPGRLGQRLDTAPISSLKNEFEGKVLLRPSGRHSVCEVVIKPFGEVKCAKLVSGCFNSYYKYNNEASVMNSWVLTLFVALNILMFLIAAGTYLCRSANEKARQRG